MGLRLYEGLERAGAHGVRFSDAHEEYPLRRDAVLESTIKPRLRKRFETAQQVIVLVGQYTKSHHKYVRWEIELAQELGLPIIVVNLNNRRRIDEDRCPPILRRWCALHVNFTMAIIQHALDHFPSWYRARSVAQDREGPRHYSDDVYYEVVGALD